jgi:fructose-specific component phosphotransferase system IIB-like protein
LTDLPSFQAETSTAADALLGDGLEPVTLGFSEPSGGAQTTVLGLLREALAEVDTDEAKVIVVHTDSWPYDSRFGARKKWIADVLHRLAAEEAQHRPGKAKGRGGRFRMRSSGTGLQPAEAGLSLLRHGGVEPSV